MFDKKIFRRDQLEVIKQTLSTKCRDRKYTRTYVTYLRGRQLFSVIFTILTTLSSLILGDYIIRIFKEEEEEE